MSDFTTSVSRPGQKTFAGANERELMLYEFGQMTIEAHEETQDFKDFAYTKRISGAISDKFPVIGRKRDATEHIPGEMILGGSIEHNEVIVSVDNMMVDSVFMASIDDILLHYDVRAAYARQLGESLGASMSKKTARMIVLAARRPALDAQGHVTPLRIGSTTMKTSAAKLEEAMYRANEFIFVNDVGGGKMRTWLPKLQINLLARYANIDSVEFSGSANRAEATVGMVGGLQPTATNWIPLTDLTNDTTVPAKYRGDFSATVGATCNQMCVGKLVAQSLKVFHKPWPERLGEAMIASELYGMDILRPECSVEFTTLTVGTNVVDIG